MIEALKKFEEAVETYISPPTLSVAIKLLKSETDIPAGIERASKVYGHRLNSCQGWAMARHNGESLAMLNGRCYFAIPCLGDRRYGSTSADEVIFTVPAARLEEIASGLKYTQEHGQTLLPKRWVDFESEQLNVYKKLRDTL